MDDNTNTATYNNESKTSILNFTGQGSSGVSPLEQEVLDEYERLSRNMKEVCFFSFILVSFSFFFSWWFGNQ